MDWVYSQQSFYITVYRSYPVQLFSWGIAAVINYHNSNISTPNRYWMISFCRNGRINGHLCDLFNQNLSPNESRIDAARFRKASRRATEKPPHYASLAISSKIDEPLRSRQYSIIFDKRQSKTVS
jgi:hypothetical protein